MTEPASPDQPDTGPPTDAPSESSTYTRVVAVRDRAGDRGQDRGQAGEGPPGDGPRAGGARAHAQDRIVAALSAVTLRGGWPACLDGTHGAVQGLAYNVAAVWRYLRGETWMRGSGNTALRLAGYLWGAVIGIPAVVVAHLAAVVAGFLADVVAVLAARNGRSVAAVAVVAAVVWTWPVGGHQAPPPTAETEIVFQQPAAGAP